MTKLLDSKKVKLGDDYYLVYLKSVPSRILPGGEPSCFFVRPFVKKIKKT